MRKEIGSETPPVSDTPNETPADGAPPEALYEETSDRTLQEATLRQIEETTESVSAVYEEEADVPTPPPPPPPQPNPPQNVEASVSMTESAPKPPEGDESEVSRPLGAAATQSAVESTEDEQKPEPASGVEQSGFRRWLRKSPKDTPDPDERSENAPPKESDGAPELQQGGEGNDGGEEPPRANETAEGGDEDGRPDFDLTASAQIANFKLDNYTGQRQNPEDVPTPEETRDTGVVMAALVKQGEQQHFEEALGNFSDSPVDQARVLAQSLNYCDRDMLPTICGTIDSIDPETLPLEIQVDVMANASKALQRETPEGVENEARPWSEHRIDATEATAQLVEPMSAIIVEVEGEEGVEMQYYDPASATAVGDIFSCAAYADTDPQTFANQAMQKITEFVTSPEGQATYEDRRGVTTIGATFAAEALRGLRENGFDQQEDAFIRELVQRPGLAQTATDHVSNEFDRGSERAPHLYELLEERREDLGSIQDVDIRRAQFQARIGDVDQALAFAETLPSYRNRIDIMLTSATTLHASGDQERALSLLEQAKDLDPRTVDAYRRSENTEEVGSLEDQLARADETNLYYRRDQALGHVAEAAVSIGAHDLALSAFAQQTDIGFSDHGMALASRDAGQNDAYLQAVLNNTEINDAQRLRALDAAFQVNQKTKFTGRPPLSSEIQEATKAYVNQLMSTRIRDRELKAYYTKHAVPILGQCGDYEGAKRAIKGVSNEHLRNDLTSQIIQHKANAGQVQEAAEYYRRHYRELGTSSPLWTAQSAIITNALWHGDEDSLRMLLGGLDSEEQQLQLNRAMTEIGDKITDPPLWAIRLMQAGGSNGIQYYLQHAGIVQDRSGKDS